MVVPSDQDPIRKSVFSGFQGIEFPARNSRLRGQVVGEYLFRGPESATHIVDLSDQMSVGYLFLAALRVLKSLPETRALVARS